MADYIYLLETRLSPQQQASLNTVRSIAREHDVTVFLVGGAIRDLISGAPVRDLDVAVQGNALKLRKALEKAGAELSAENTTMQQLHLRFASGVRMEVGSTLSATFPKPGRIAVKPTTILDDLRRRDFTANAMALSLNEGSYGLLMDPLNGVADIENRELRLVSNYGFIEDPVRLLRAARLMARLGWRLDEKTQGRYQTAKEENYISAMQPGDRAYELEEVFHEEDPLRVMQRLEEEGWLQHLSPVLSAGKANLAELARLRDVQSQLYEQGVVADAAAANFPLVTAKMSAKDVASLKESFPRKAFVREIDSLEPQAKEFATRLTSKQASLPSQAFQMIAAGTPAVVLWTAFTSKSAAVQGKFKSFYTEWPQNRQRLPYLLMQEMRITSDLPGYDDLLEKLFFGLMDGQLETPEALRAFLEPFSPPAPPPPVSLRRARAAKGGKKESRSAKAKKAAQPPHEVSSDAADTVPAPAAPPEAPPAAAAPASARKTVDKEQPSQAKRTSAPEKSADDSVRVRPAVVSEPAKKTAPAKPKPASSKASAKPKQPVKKAPAQKGGKAAVRPPAKPAKKALAKKGHAAVTGRASSGKKPVARVAPGKPKKSTAKPGRRSAQKAVASASRSHGKKQSSSSRSGRR